MKKTSRIAAITAILTAGALALVGCRPGGPAITLAGSTAFQPFAEKLAEQYMAAHPGVNITVQGGGSAVGIQSALSGAAEVGMADLVQLPPEAANLTSVVVARDGIVLIVHPGNGVTDLTTDQVRDIFNGKITNWKDIGGAEAPITVVSREAGSGTRSSFEQIIGNIHLINEAIIQDSNGTIRETVANNPNALGYISHGILNDSVRALTLDGGACEPASINDGNYKLVRPIFLLTQSAPQGLAKEFIDYILSAEGQQSIKNDGLLPVK